MAKIVSLSELKDVKTNSTLKDFIASLAASNLESGSHFSGTVMFRDFPARMSTAEIQGVILDRGLVDLTLTSTNVAPYRWTCSSWTNTLDPKWIAR